MDRIILIISIPWILKSGKRMVILPSINPYEQTKEGSKHLERSCHMKRKWLVTSLVQMDTMSVHYRWSQTSTPRSSAGKSTTVLSSGKNAHKFRLPTPNLFQVETKMGLRPPQIIHNIANLSSSDDDTTNEESSTCVSVRERRKKKQHVLSDNYNSLKNI